MLFWVGVVLTVPATRAAPPPNDQFANRILVSGESISLTGNVAEATAEPGEPNVAGAAGHSIWWTWIPERDGLIYLSGKGIYSLFEGETLSSLRLIRTDSSFTPPLGGAPALSPSSLFSFIPVRAGIAYQLRLDSNPCTFEPPRPPPFRPICNAMGTTLTVELTFQLGASDSFEGRQSVSSEAPSFPALNGFASREDHEPESPMGAGFSVWWSWTVPATGRYEMESILGGNSAVVDVFRGDQLDRLEPVVSQKVAKPLVIFAWGRPPNPTFIARQGEQLAVRGDALAGATAGAAVCFTFWRLPRPPNDDFADAIAITNGLAAGAFPYIEANLAGATPEPGESFPATRSAWWRWTPPVTGEYILERSGIVANGPMPGRPNMAIQLGEGITDLVKVAELTPESDVVRFFAQAGRSYMVVADQQNEADSMFARFRLLPVAPHDEPDAPLDINHGPELVRVTVDGAGVMPWETWANSGRSVWLRWRAPADGYLAIRAWTWEETLLVVGPETGFTNTSPALARSWFQRPATFPVAAEQTYLIAVLPNNRFSGLLNLEADFTSARLIWPTDGTVFPDGKAELSAELAASAATNEAVITGVGWELRPRLAGSAWPTNFPGDPVLTRNGAAWTGVPSGVWQLRVTLTNEYGRQFSLPPVSVRLPPPNDSLSGAVAVTELPWSSPSVSTAGAGAEPGEPVHPGNSETNSVWWTWTPPTDAVVVAHGKGSAVAVFAGNDIANLRPAASSVFSPLRIQARAGQPLSFRVTPNPERILSRGTVALELRPQLPGDEFSNRGRLASEGGPFVLPVGPSSVEEGEPFGNGSGSVPSLWWTWIPPANGTLILRGATFYPGQEGYVSTWRAFEGETLATLTERPPLRWRMGLPEEGQPLMDWGDAAFSVRRGVPVQIAGELLAYSRPEAEARLEFVPDPGLGQIGAVAFVKRNSSQSWIMFPVMVEAGDNLVIEGSEDLASWGYNWSASFDQEGTTWLGPWPNGDGRRFFRVIRTRPGR